MAGVYLNEAEQKVLDQLDYIYEALYRRGIRRYMDYQTGLVGVKRGISWQSLKEELYIEPRKGIAKKNISKDQVRRLAKTLERVGLVRIKSGPKRLIFECLLATSDKSVQNKPATIPATLTQKNASKAATLNLFEPIENKGFGIVKNKKAATSTHPKYKIPAIDPATPPSNIYISTNVDILSDFEIKKIFEEDFWKIYPQGYRVKKKQAFDIYKRKKFYASPKRETIRDDVTLRKQKHRSWLDGYVPHPTTYLNGERWEDEIQELTINGSHRKPSARENIQRVINSCFEDAESTIEEIEFSKTNITKMG